MFLCIAFASERETCTYQNHEITFARLKKIRSISLPTVYVLHPLSTRLKWLLCAHLRHQRLIAREYLHSCKRNYRLSGHFVCSRNFRDHYQMMDGRTSSADQNSLLRPGRGLNNCIIVFIMMRFYANLNNGESRWERDKKVNIELIFRTGALATKISRKNYLSIMNELRKNRIKFFKKISPRKLELLEPE